MPEHLWRRGPDGELIRAPSRAPAASPAGDAEPAAAPGHRPSLLLALRLGFRDTYDYLGSVLLASVVWAVIVALALLCGQAVGILAFQRNASATATNALSVLTAVLGWVLVGGPLLAGVYRFARNATARQEPEVFDLAWGFRSALRRSLGLAAVQSLGALILASDVSFFFRPRHLPFLVIDALFVYALLFWTLMSFYAWPLLAEQEIGVGAIIRKAALMVLDNFGYTAGLAVVLLAISGVLWATVIGGVLLWAGAVAMFHTQATRELLRKYGLLPPDPTVDPVSTEVES